MLRRIVTNEHTIGALQALLYLGILAGVYLSGWHLPDIG